MRIKQSIPSRVFDVFLYVFFVVLCIAMIYPFWNSIVISLMTPAEAGRMGVKLYPQSPTLASYRHVFKSQTVFIGYRNTIMRTVFLMVFSTFLTFCAAYPLAKRSLPGLKTITMYLLIPMFFSGGLIPSYLLVNNLGIFDTFWALVLPNLISIYNILITRNFLMSIPDSMEESAVLDGASYWTVMLKIILPLSTPILATIALWVAVAAWNEWFNAKIYTRSNDLIVLQTYLRKITIERTSDMDDLLGDEAVLSKSIEAATIMASIGPIIFVYPFFQKYFVKGVMVGSLKG